MRFRFVYRSPPGPSHPKLFEALATADAVLSYLGDLPSSLRLLGYMQHSVWLRHRINY